MAAIHQTQEGLFMLPLPGFMPDAVPFALRLTTAMLLAYLVAFAIQLDSASSAGVCVGIVMQPSLGMTVSKAAYRTFGTLLGGAAALVITGLFPQDRTMLLMAVSIWLGACTFAASLLRDFRAYGAVLAGYTVAIICVGQIDAPANVLLTALDRVAAILVGIVCVGLVNAAFTGSAAHTQLLAGLERHLEDSRATALAVLEHGIEPERDVSLQRASDLLGLRTDASYASVELADGYRRNQAATAALAAMLDMLAASRELGRALSTRGRDALASRTRAYLDELAEALRNDRPALPPPAAATPYDTLAVDRAGALARSCAGAALAVRATRTGNMAGVPARPRVPSDPDRIAAVSNAARAMIATGLGSVLCVIGGDETTTLLLIQLAALVALVGLQPDPTAPASAFLPALPFAATLAGAIVFLGLPLASGFPLFALVVAPAVFVLGLASRHPGTAKYGSPLLIYFTILLSPSNLQTFDPQSFCNLVLQLSTTAVLTVLTFRVLLPTSPRLRLLRVAGKIAGPLRRVLRDGHAVSRRRDRELAPTYDRLSQAFRWARARRQPGAHPVLTSLCAFAELDAAIGRAAHGLHELSLVSSDGHGPVGKAWRALARADAAELEAAARELLASRAAPAESMRLAVSGLQGAAILLRQQRGALCRYGLIRA